MINRNVLPNVIGKCKNEIIYGILNQKSRIYLLSYWFNILNNNTMRTSKFKRPNKVLVFNGARVLVAVVRSLCSAAELTNNRASAAHNCCTGKTIRSGLYYYRQLHPDVLIEMDDLDCLKLEEYDKMCGDERKYITTSKMAHIRQRVAENKKSR